MSKSLSPPRYLPMGPQITTVQNGPCVQWCIWPYTWQHKRATVAGRSAHYAQETRNHHHARRENRARAVKSHQNRRRRLVNTVILGPTCHVPSVTQRVTLFVRWRSRQPTSSLMSWGRVENKQNIIRVIPICTKHSHSHRERLDI